MNYDELLSASTEIGFRLLKNGAEIYRVEESIGRILRAYNIDSGEVFAIPNCLIVSFCDDKGQAMTRVKRVPYHGIDLTRVERYNALCRRICTNTPDIAAVKEEIREIENCPKYNMGIQAVAFFIGSFAFTLLYGGILIDAICAGACGVAVRLATYNMERFQTNLFFKNIVASAVAAAIAILSVYLGIGVNMDKITIGALMSLVPGIVITNFMRDIMAGDWVAGLTKLTESLLIATAIALGAGIALAGSRLLGGI